MLRLQPVGLLLFLILAITMACSPPGPTVSRQATATLTVVAPTPTAATYQNPIYPYDFPDPFLLRIEETYYAFATDVGSTHVPVIQSTDLARWKWVGDALPELPAWAAQTTGLTWAPGVLQTDNSFVLYYTTRDTASDRQCIGLATAERPEGSYTDNSTEAFICQTDLGGSIDSYPFIDDNGTTYLLWKNDGNCYDLPVGIWVQQLSDDGLRLVDERTELIRQD